jgi:hypothetical protein
MDATAKAMAQKGERSCFIDEFSFATNLARA